MSLGSGKTVTGKLKFEERFWNQAEVEIKNLHEDNCIFIADVFQNDCDKKVQYHSFLVLERRIIMLNQRGLYKIL